MFKFKIYVCSALLMLSGLLVSERAEAACTASVTPLNFGDINWMTTTGQVDFTATVTYSCSGLINVLSRLYVCIEIAPGSGGTGLTPRTLTHNSISTEKLTFNI
ncbi:MAG: fimbrial major subunit CsuA/B family protein [Alcaligenaceae bacterium]|nr:fimbrial major subunit CsuA/B family protein [Alcaligenaceae bacterium]